ncbi:CFLAR [Branchiostoma lanceolatum]|uniref:CFLAR protein n=1 Tax=Branchiostoma lanceolatum TaxID=7740 RepID=A0A8J9ZSS2_BRALA|nr:CFLAR [Branchiostoma lanceolatum]
MSGSDRPTISPFRALLLRLSEQLSARDLRDMKHLLRDHVGERRREEAQSCLDLWADLEKAGLLTDGRTDLLTDLLDKLHRKDLVRRVEEYENERKGKSFHLPTSVQSEPQSLSCQTLFNGLPITVATDGPRGQPQSVTRHHTGGITAQHAPGGGNTAQHAPGGDNTAQHAPGGGNTAQHAPGGDNTAQHAPGGGNTAQHAPGGDNTAQHAPGGGDTSQHAPGDKRQTAVRIKEQRFPPKAQNYLETGGYRVGIVGGKHYEIDEEEFVEMDHGSSYRIRLTNTHPRPCDAQLAIDGKEVGTWRLDPHQEVELERPEDEQMCFSFFSTRMAPAEAGIRRGEEENGLVQVTFTPEKRIEREERTVVKDPYRGGDMVAGDDTASSDSSSQDEDEPFRSDTPLNWSSGATALQGVSRQEFEQVEGEMERDEEAQVVMILRLVARTDAPRVEVSSAPVKPLMSKRPRAVPD